MVHDGPNNSLCLALNNSIQKFVKNHSSSTTFAPQTQPPLARAAPEVYKLDVPNLQNLNLVLQP
jgi:hypothetical protein